MPDRPSAPAASTRCPRCGAEFRCQPEDIRNCQCSAVPLSEELRERLEREYDGCLCANCLRELAGAPKA